MQLATTAHAWKRENEHSGRKSAKRGQKSGSINVEFLRWKMFCWFFALRRHFSGKMGWQNFFRKCFCPKTLSVERNEQMEAWKRLM
jgi:hypothetical protein